MSNRSSKEREGLRGKRERAAVKAQSKSALERVELTNKRDPKGTPTTADEVSGRPSLQPGETNIFTTADAMG